MPPLHVFLTCIFLYQLYGVVALLFSRVWAPSVFGGGLLGYIVYDVAHYFIHHGAPINDITRRLKVVSCLPNPLFFNWLDTDSNISVT